MRPARVGLTIACAVLASTLFQACTPSQHESGLVHPATAQPEAAAVEAAPGLEALRNMTFVGIYDEPVALLDGHWQGEPFAPGGASRPTAGLAEDFYLSGDLDGDDAAEAVVVLWRSSGGSGTFVYLAAVGRRDGVLVNLGTAPIGDRVQIRSGRVEDRRILLDVVEQGPGDAACCPAQKAARQWSLTPDGLVEGEARIEGRLSTADLEGPAWRLLRIDQTAPPPSVDVTLSFDRGRLTGQGPCNRYFGAFGPGQTAGTLEIDERIGSTRMACAEPVMQFEQTYFQALGTVRRYGFSSGRLVLTAQNDGTVSSLIFEAQTGP